MSRPPNPLPSRLGRAFSAAEARAAGVPWRRLRQPDVERVSRGAYLVRSDDEVGRRGPKVQSRQALRIVERARALARVLPPGYAFSGLTAAAIWGLPLPRDAGRGSGSGPGVVALDPELEVACHHPLRGLRRQGVSCVRVSSHLASFVVHRGLPVTNPASTWAMLAPRLDRGSAIALGDAVLHIDRIPGTNRVARPPLATLPELQWAIDAGRRRGAAALRAQLPLLSTRSASAPESHLRVLLMDWDAPEPTLDYDVRAHNGMLLGCSEIAYPELRLAFEYEGDHHRTDRFQWNRDIAKYQAYTRSGWEVMRITASAMYGNPDRLRDQVFEALGRRGWRGTAPLRDTG